MFAAVVIVAVVAIALLALSGGDDVTATEAPAGAPSTGLDDSGAAPSSDPPASSRDSATDSPEPTPAAAAVQCWDGRLDKDLSQCGSPYDAVNTSTPLAGLNWVFRDRGPRLESVDAQCDDTESPGRLLHRQCTLQVAGALVCMNYSQFIRPAAALADYGNLGTPRQQNVLGGATVLSWGPAYTSGGGCQGLPYKGAKMVKGQLWGVSAYSNSSFAVVQALARFGEFRPIDEWAGIAN